MQINLLASVFTFTLIGAYPACCLSSDNIADPKRDVPAKIVYVAFQDTLELNCSVEHLCKELVSSDHILWKHNNTWIQNFTHRVNNNTVQLRRKTISFEDAGVYECIILNCSQHLNIHPKIVTVVVGVKPPKPTQPKVAVFGMPPQNVTFVWAGMDVNWTGEVWLGVMKNRCVYTFSLCKQRASSAYEVLTCSVGHSVLEKLFSRNVSTSAPKSTTSHIRRDVLCVMGKVSNAFGSSFSQERWYNLNHETRCPAPRDFGVLVGDHNATASWLRPPLVSPNYLLFYHLEYRAKSLLGWSPDRVLDSFEEEDTVEEDVRIIYPITSDLLPNTKYEFRLYCSFLPHETGPAVRTEVTTKEAAPSEAPVIDRCGVKRAESLKSCHMDVLVAWKLPPNNTWNGIPRKFTAHYWQDNNSSYNDESLVDFNGSATEGVLKDVNACKNITIRLSMCTKGGCGPLSGPCLIRAKNDTSKGDLRHDHGSTEGNRENNFNMWLAVGLGISAGLVLASVLIGSIQRKRLRKRRQRRLSDLVGPLNDFHRYENEFDDRPSVCEASQEYDEVVICDSSPLLAEIAGGVGRIPVTRI